MRTSPRAHRSNPSQQPNNSIIACMQMLSAPADMERFQEADVLWPDHSQDNGHGHRHPQQRRRRGRKPDGDDASRGGEVRRPVSSAPVGIPVARSTAPAWWAPSYDGDDGGDGAAFVPPHVLVAARRCSEERAASSMCEGHGRTLKGRDLRCVRTAVLRMTGFLES
ncbi:protein S40-1-like [Phragmites australis]|uniref:protein S40-1-like n=1 Tax=Phragmites australis TaxID=29695 RepID=UPI002D79DB9D|nr:protein S40-1-like [Phragmites australis]